MTKETPSPVPAPTEVVAWMDDGKKIHNGPGHLVFRVITADTKRNMPASIQAEYTTPLVAQQIQAPAEGDGVRAALERFCDATACIPLPGQPFTTTMFQTLGMALSEARAALDGLPNVQPKGMQAEWQPIATAPRDGSEVLIFEVYERLPVIGWWSEKRKRWHASTEVYDTDGDATVIDKLYTDGVTHWMPLPAPPVMDANDDEVQS